MEWLSAAASGRARRAEAAAARDGGGPWGGPSWWRTRPGLEPERTLTQSTRRAAPSPAHDRATRRSFHRGSADPGRVTLGAQPMWAGVVAGDGHGTAARGPNAPAGCSGRNRGRRRTRTEGRVAGTAVPVVAHTNRLGVCASASSPERGNADRSQASEAPRPATRPGAGDTLPTISPRSDRDPQSSPSRRGHEARRRRLSSPLRAGLWRSRSWHARLPPAAEAPGPPATHEGTAATDIREPPLAEIEPLDQGVLGSAARPSERLLQDREHELVLRRRRPALQIGQGGRPDQADLPSTSMATLSGRRLSQPRPPSTAPSTSRGPSAVVSR